MEKSKSNFQQTPVSTTHNSMLDFQVTLYPTNCLGNCLTGLETTTQMFAKLSKPTSMECVAGLPKAREILNSTSYIYKPVKEIQTRKYGLLIEMKSSSNHWLIAPPPEPPDIVAMRLLNLSLLLTRTECFTENQCHNIVAYRLLPSTLQVFDQMSKNPVIVWIAFPTVECTNNGQFVDFDLSKGMNQMCSVHRHAHYTLFNILSFCYLEFWYFGRHSHFEDEVTMKFILELKVRKHPYNYKEGFNINGYECCLYSISGTLSCCDRCPAKNHSRCIIVMGLWFLHNSFEYCLLFCEDLKHKPNYYSTPNAYTRVFQECRMFGDSRNCFELSCVGCICMRTDVRHKKNHNHIGWKWKKVSSVLFLSSTHSYFS
jgi:hypothetical protein